MRTAGYVLIFLFGLLALSGCGKTGEEDGNQSMDIYYLNKDETGIDSEPYTLQDTDTNRQIHEIM